MQRTVVVVVVVVVAVAQVKIYTQSHTIGDGW